MGKRSRIVLVAFLSTAIGFADSVTWIVQAEDGSSVDRTVNGTVTKLPGGDVKLEARFAAGLRTFPIPLNNVRSIEINLVAFNPGAPPQASALKDGPKMPAPSSKSGLADAVELRGSHGALELCKVASIDDKVVRCDAQGKANAAEYPRSLVLRIIVRGDQ